MWYFSWILGTALAAGFAVLNALWFELDPEREDLKNISEQRDDNTNPH